MHPMNYPAQRHRDLLAEAERDSRAAQVRAMHRASRRVERAARRLERAQASARRVRSAVRPAA
jgi:hypothetical protein